MAGQAFTMGGMRKARVDAGVADPVSPSENKSSLMMKPQLVDEFKQVFKRMDRNSDGLLTRTEMKHLLSALGQKPSDEEVEDLVKEISGTTAINERQFLQFISNQLRNQDLYEEFSEAWRLVNEKNHEYIRGSDLQVVMARLGEHLSDEEAIELIQHADKDRKGGVDYREFVGMLTS